MAMSACGCETGRYIDAEVDCPSPADVPTAADLMGDDAAWRLASLSFRPEPSDPPA